jgi:hypothetical protein
LDLPHDIKVDISHIAEAGEVLFFKDIKVGDKVTIDDDLEQPVLTAVAFSDEPEEVKPVAEAATPAAWAAGAAPAAWAKPGAAPAAAKPAAKK